MTNLVSNKIRGIKSRKCWGAFSPDGYLQFRTISTSRKEAEQRLVGSWEIDKTWSDYAKAGYTTNKILVDIKLL